MSEGFAFSGVSMAIFPLLAISVLVEVFVFAAGLFVEKIFGFETRFVIGLTLALGAAAFGFGNWGFFGLNIEFLFGVPD